MQGKLLTISGPSGSGKNFLIHHLITLHPELFVYIPSSTTKPADGTKDYIFLSNEEYVGVRKRKGFVNDVEGGIYSYSYGYMKETCENAFNEKKWGIITPYGPIIKNVINDFRENYELEIISMYLKPVHLGLIKDRMIKRGRESEERILKKLADAQKELDNFDSFKDVFDKVFEIDDDEIEKIEEWINLKVKIFK